MVFYPDTCQLHSPAGNRDTEMTVSLRLVTAWWRFVDIIVGHATQSDFFVGIVCGECRPERVKQEGISNIPLFFQSLNNWITFCYESVVMKTILPGRIAWRGAGREH